MGYGYKKMLLAKIVVMTKLLPKTGEVLVAAVVVRAVMAEVTIGQACGHGCGLVYGEGCSR